MANLKDKNKIRDKLKRGATELEQKKLLDTFARLEEEEVTQAGQENEIKGAHAVIEIDKEEEQHGEQIHWRDLNYLEAVQTKPNEYKLRLMEIAENMISPERFAIPIGFGMGWWQNSIGMGLAIQIPDKTDPVTRQWRIAYQPKYDKAMIEMYIEHAFEFMDNMTRSRAQKNGLYLPKQTGPNRGIIS